MEFILYQILWCNMEWYVWHLPRRMLPKIWEEEGFTHFLRVWEYVTQITINVHEILKNFIGKLASITKSTRTTTPKNSKKSAIHFSCFLIRAKHLSYHEWKKNYPSHSNISEELQPVAGEFFVIQHHEWHTKSS